MLENLSAYHVGQAQLPTLHYIPDFLSAAEEQRLLQEVHASKAKWVQLSGRRLQNHGGIVHTKGLIPAPLPTWLQQLLARLPPQLLALFPPDQPPNHVLINAYQPGCGIMPHEDGPLYHPVVLILSLGSPAVLRFWRKQPTGGTGGAPPVASLLAQPRSLLVFQDDAYSACLHGIQEVSQELLDSSIVNAVAAGVSAVQTKAASDAAEGGAAAWDDSNSSSSPQQQGQAQQQASACNPAAAAAAASTVQQQQQQPGCIKADGPSDSKLQPAAEAVECHERVAQQQQSGLAQPGVGCACSQQGAMQHCSPDRPDTSATTPTLARQGERISLTIRRVLKVHKGLGLMPR